MYCGDETGSFIGDIGSHYARFGYGGDDAPTYVVPAYAASLKTDNNSNTATNNVSASSRDKRKRDDSKWCIPTSPYKSTWAQCELKAALQLAQLQTESQALVQHIMNSDNSIDHSGNNTKSTSATSNILSQPTFGEPLVDPVQYLSQGSCVQNWDAYEALWQSALDVLHVKDRFKHTTGGSNGRHGQSQNSREKHASGVSSNYANSTITAADPFDCACVHPLLAVSPGYTYLHNNPTSNTTAGVSANKAAYRQQLAKYVEILLEKFDAPAAFVAPSPMLASFSCGRPTSLVVDVGAAGCRVTPVVDGLVLQQAQRRNGRGGDWLGNVAWHALLNEKVLLRPRYVLSKNNPALSTVTPGQTQSAVGLFHRWAMQDLMYELRTCQHVGLEKLPGTYQPPFMPHAATPGSSLAINQNRTDIDSSVHDAMDVDNSSTVKSVDVEHYAGQSGPIKTFELPDGTLLDLSTELGRDICRIPELLFSNAVPFIPDNSSSLEFRKGILSQHSTLSDAPLHKLIYESLTAVSDVDIRKDLCANIVLVGGSSVIPNLESRLSAELTQLLPSAYKCKVIASRHVVERACAAWIGGSILTSLGSFQQLWLSRKEYDEYGATLGVQRFP